MLKKVFIKNFYQTISSLGVVVVLEIPIIVGFLYSLQSDEKYGWILLIVSAIIAFLYFGIGFYWIFQKIIITNNSIRIIFLGKTISEYLWTDVTDIKKSNHLKNPALKITLKNGNFLYLDDRKKIRYAITTISKIDIE